MSDFIRFVSDVTRNPHKTYRRLIQWFPVSRSRVCECLTNMEVFFIVSTGRTGTKWLSNLLNKAEGSYVVHEPVPLETLAHKAAVMQPGSAEAYIRDFRVKEIYRRLRKRRGVRAYGEVNGILRRHIEPIQTHIPNAKILHLVRDGRAVVRSIVSRGTYSGRHPVYRDFAPPLVDEWSERWAELSEFERTAWIWQWENRYIRSHIQACARFEDITTSYDAFRRQLLEPLELEIGRPIWEKSIHRPENVSPEYAMGEWDDWTEEQREVFVQICGDEMREYGYIMPSVTQP